jgi:4-diphosphocytidyl-2-C-methyl-D-erythritol kinase
MSRTLVLRPPAKINLTLRVGPLRGDGFHDVRTLLQSVALSDT